MKLRSSWWIVWKKKVVGIDDMERKTREIVASTLDEEADRELVPQGVAV
jgi:hypothetical protein